MVPASVVTEEPTKCVRLPNYASNSSSTSIPRPGRLGSPTRHALDDNSTAALRRDKGLPGFSGEGLFAADDPDIQDPDADAHSSLPSSFLPDSTSRAIPSTDTAGLLTQHTLPSSEAPDEQDLVDLPETLSRYEKKLKFVGQWHASLVKKGISEHLAYELAKYCVQASDEEGDLGTDSHYTDDETVVIRLGAGARAPKQGLGGDDKPATLVEALRAKSRLKNHSEEGHDAFDTLAIAQRLQEKDFGGRLSSQEICVISIAILHEVFGGRGQKRLADALTHLYGRYLRRHLADLDRNAGRVADEIRKDGPAILSSFTLRWAQAVQHDSPNILTIDDIRLIDMKVSLVREWDRWSSQAATGSDRDIEDFLAKNRINANAGLALSTRIAKYLSRKLSLPEGTLAKKIYAWRPLIVMADVFGAGIYVFVSRSLFTCYNKIYPTDGIKKEDKFCAMALAIADELPDLLEICEALYTHIVQPVLKPVLPGNNMQDLSRDLRVPGVQMAIEGDLHSLRKTSIPELLGVYISPRGFVEELGSVTGGDADAETILVRRQSTLHRHHKDGKDSNSNDDDDDDDRSGEEEDENYND
ncbi:hypothetical protein F53441_12410 [Fusarium austroafricanum]|uniref:Uncharacterized protein n=1 Tax=Fusarium austroafricanum TaxID=2364996 RepID=A0A8H4NJ94_9HYPO|nr:hypothetical protein F53441_12410 [Fusarium austroafricanum]